jgi:hypothetical protein
MSVLKLALDEFKSARLPSVGPKCKCGICGVDFNSLAESEDPDNHAEACLYRQLMEALDTARHNVRHVLECSDTTLCTDCRRLLESTDAILNA